ncbi:MAG TPA: hypothetical protein H9903_12520 [Candidatus Aquabacterium excrementipullorum]|nr:hypothetical protein [Candidatus Aquabacterium excrementipullorum]
MTIKTVVASFVLGLACVAGVANAAPAAEPTTETSLRQSMQEALWPADIVQAAGDYLRQYPNGDWADAARALYERASTSARVLARSDVRLYRGAFQSDLLPAPVKADLRKAALGDQDAAVRLAHAYKQAGGDKAGSRYVGWLQYAAVMGHDKAAYELALHFRNQDQPVLASQYEARALALGYVMPTVLDHVRK